MTKNRTIINFSNVLVVVGFAISVAVWQIKPLASSNFLQLLLNLEGTAFLAGAISSGSNTDGLGNNLKEKLEWIFIKPMKYSSPACFNQIRFYLGIFFLFIGSVIGSLQ